MQRADPVGQGGEAWIGYKQDLRPCQMGLMMSIEPSFSVFYQGKPVVDFCQAVLSRGRNEWQWTADQLTDRERLECGRELKGLTVRAPLQRRLPPGTPALLQSSHGAALQPWLQSSPPCVARETPAL